MNEHFRAFTFVDRILSLDTGVKIAGSYAIPPGIDSFPYLLVAEAIGQLGAWCAMAAVDFKCRPVSGLTHNVELFSAVRPGQALELTAHVESVDTETAVYGGAAHADGVPVIRLERHVGPMMPLEDFDDPSAVRDRFALLCGQGATPGGFPGMPSLALKQTVHEIGRRECATLQVPEYAPFFADHFPRRPVFPGTLLMSANFELADALLAGIPAPANGHVWKLHSVSDVKFRTFTPPKASLECEARLDNLSANSVLLTVESRDARRLVASAKALYYSEARP